MAACIYFYSPTPQTIPHHHSSSFSTVSALFTRLSYKSLPTLDLLYSPNNFVPLTSKSYRNCVVSAELGAEVEDEGEVEGVDSSRDEEPNFPAELKVFVGNLPFSVDSAALAELFGKAGNVEMVEVIYDKFSGRSRGFGFVTMSTAEEAEAAVQQFNGYELSGRALRVNSGPPPAKSSFQGGRGRERGSFDSANRLYVGNLAWGVDNLALETLFSEQGKVKEARVVYDKESGRSRGFGFVTYSSPEEVNNAIEVLDGIDLNGRAIRVSLAEARPMRQ